MDQGGGLFQQDSLAYGGGWLREVDSRSKVLFVLACLALNLSARELLPPLTLILLTLLGLLSCRIPWRLLLVRLAPPTGIVAAIFAFHFLFGGRAALKVGLLTAVKAWAGILLILLLGISTPFSHLMQTGRWMHFPQALLEVLALTYRYVFLLFEEVLRVRQAQAARLGYRSAATGLQSMGALMGVLLLRLPDRAEAVQQAMCARGYQEGSWIQAMDPFCRKDAWQAALLGLCWLFLLLLRLNR